MAHHPWLTILAWVVAAVAVIATSPGLPTTTNESSFLPKSYESIRAANLQDKALPQAGHVTAFASLILAGNTILAQLGFAVACGIALAAFVMAMFFPQPHRPLRPPGLVARPRRRTAGTRRTTDPGGRALDRLARASEAGQSTTVRSE